MHNGLILLPEMLINDTFIVKKLSELTLQIQVFNFPAGDKVEKSQVSKDFLMFTGDNNCQY